MTLIAIFATLSETSAAISLPFLDNDERDLYVWFLISFPFYLLLLFFVTLNFNYRSLYAPSDFADENNFLNATEQSDNNSTESPSRQSTSKDATKSRSSPDNAQAPPVSMTPQATACGPEAVPLPNDVKDLRIVDTRETGKKIEFGELLKNQKMSQNSTAHVILFVTSAQTEGLLKSSVLKHLKQKRKATAAYPVAYNLDSHKLAVIDQGWTAGIKD